MGNLVLADSKLISTEMMTALNDVLFLIPNWKWIALGLLIFAIFSVRPLIQIILEKFKESTLLRRRSGSFIASLLSLETQNPAAWVLTLAVAIAALDSLSLTPGLAKSCDLALKIGLAWHLIRFVYMAVDAIGLMATKYTSTKGLEGQLIPFGIKALKVLSVVLGVLIALQNFGINVMGLLAGLGLGGLALALAAQDTAANIFGSITILFDQPFKVGDWIKIGETEGTVEEVGFRSTRIRTFYNSLVAIPNSIVAKERVDNRQARKRRRVQQTLALGPASKPKALEDFCVQAKALILAESDVDRDVTVAFNNFNRGSFDVLVQFFLSHSTDAEEVALSQKIFLALVRLAEVQDIKFADSSPKIYIGNSEPR